MLWICITSYFDNVVLGSFDMLESRFRQPPESCNWLNVTGHEVECQAAVHATVEVLESARHLLVS